MLDVAVMIEAQDGLNWPRWQAIAGAVEAAGFAGLFRSDHFVNPRGPWKEALELWTSLTWLASHTRRIEFGPLVSPISFRAPVITAWQAACVDDLSGGRLRLGLGAGWQEREHAAFGYDLLPLKERFARFEEGLEVITRLLRSGTPTTFDGRFYRLHEALLMPRPRRRDLPIVIGGKGPRRTLGLVVQYAAEWNTTGMPLEEWTALNARLDDLLRQAGREPRSVRRTLMTTVVFGRDEAELGRKLGGTTAEALRARGLVVGTAPAIAQQLRDMAADGLDRAMLRWQDLDDTAGLRALGEGVLGRL
ncbi:MAG: TIGR03560 family F420-dependent LLM class oxidoreductase [Chloroflexi bacterium]|nr:TIGR03560 family F420-dependent LLM class oxidoreductase [Chloroflexota bacterium]